MLSCYHVCLSVAVTKICPPALLEDCLVFLPYVSRKEMRMKFLRYIVHENPSNDRSFAEARIFRRCFGQQVSPFKKKKVEKCRKTKRSFRPVFYSFDQNPWDCPSFYGSTSAVASPARRPTASVPSLSRSAQRRRKRQQRRHVWPHDPFWLGHG